MSSSSSVTAQAEDSGSDGGGGAQQETKPMAPGEAKARAMASIKAYVANLPPLEIGRDEAWITSKEEGRGTATAGKNGVGGGGGNGGGGGGAKRARDKERTDGQGKEKKPKAGKREEKQREEEDLKQRLSEVRCSVLVGLCIGSWRRARVVDCRSWSFYFVRLPSLGCLVYRDRFCSVKSDAVPPAHPRNSRRR